MTRLPGPTHMGRVPRQPQRRKPRKAGTIFEPAAVRRPGIQNSTIMNDAAGGPNPELLPRIEAATRAVSSQIELFHREFGRAKSYWKSDGTRVTDVDIAISENIVRE